MQKIYTLYYTYIYILWFECHWTQPKIIINAVSKYIIAAAGIIFFDFFFSNNFCKIFRIFYCFFYEILLKKKNEKDENLLCVISVIHWGLWQSGVIHFVNNENVLFLIFVSFFKLLLLLLLLSNCIRHYGFIC